ncbi:uncharacterized protein LOC141901194 [Tubulanus polymorphus]|uniref:uncharacterized protein LOC141901194 n=1 Tax=Tubulanus polymorphus TaxID=672921 RepID=UPI003DA252F3
MCVTLLNFLPVFDEDVMDELAKALHLPVEHLSLQPTECDQDAEPECYTKAGTTLSPGKIFGPYAASETSDNSVENLIQVSDGIGKGLLVASESGAWLKLVRKSGVKEEDDSNSLIRFTGRNISCEITSEIPPDTSLVAVFELAIEEPDENIDASPSEVTAQSVPSTEAADAGVTSLSSEMVQDGMKLESTVGQRSVPGFQSKLHSSKSHPLIFVCRECGVRFSSPSTLSAHTAYYCSKRRSESGIAEPVSPITTKPVKRESDESNIDTIDGCHSVKRSRVSRDSDEDKADFSNCEDSLPLAKSRVDSPPKLRCSHCSFKSHDPAKIRIHIVNTHTPPSKTENTQISKSPESLASPSNEIKKNSYCERCNIHFSSVKTYLGHKEYYCGKRQNVKVLDVVEPGSVSDDESEEINVDKEPTVKNTASASPGSIPLGAVPQLPPRQIVVPYTVSASANGAQQVVFAAPIVSPDGTGSVAFTVPTVIMQPVIAGPVMHPAHQQLLSVGRPSRVLPSEQPLDLSMKKETEKRSTENRGSRSENVDSITIKTEQLDPTSPNGVDITTDALDQSKSPGMTKSPPSTAVMNSPISPTLLSQVPTLMQHLTAPKLVGIGQSSAAVGCLSNFNMCAECNIVFYKHENYVIHKQYYCSGRRPSKANIPSLPSPECHADKSKFSHEPSSSHIPLQRCNPTSPEPGPSSPVHQQFGCTPCQIRFSSISTLEAHQKYYCPYRGKDRNGDATDGTPSPDSGGDTAGSSAVYRCTHCATEYPTARLLKVHLCPRTANGTGIWNLLRCPHCSFVTHKESAYSDHVKKHVSNKGYKCKLCGYRGNTVRGMRMHGKMHIDNGEEFTDMDMIELKLDTSEDTDDVSSSTHIAVDSDLESEIIRLKNEPYKRRRSRYRRALETIDHDRQRSPPQPHLPTPEKLPPFVCGICNSGFADYAKLESHMQRHMEEKAFKCHLCPSDAFTQIEFSKHMSQKHPNLELNLQDGSRYTTGQLSAVGDISNTTVQGNDTENCPITETDVKRETKSPEISIDGDSIDGNVTIPNIKQENAECLKNDDDRMHKPSSFKYCQTTKSRSSSVSPSLGNMKAPLSPANPPPVDHVPHAAFSHQITGRYCKECEIPFTYVSSFIAHKKHYCPAGNTNENACSLIQPESV